MIGDLDFKLFQLINSLIGRFPLLDALARFLGNDYVITTALVALLVFLWFSRDEHLQAAVLRAGLALLLVNGLVKLCNLFWFRARPFTHNDIRLLFYHPSDSSFPSNIAATCFALAWTIWLACPNQRRYAALMVLGATLLSLARLYIGVHYPLDILGGILTGMLAAWLVQRLAPLLQPLTHGVSRLAARVGLA
jgi:undecaprenyl-diphosphatase